MKYRSLLFVLCVFFSKLINGQVYLNEGFESAFAGTPGEPTGWTQSWLVPFFSGEEVIWHDKILKE
jgi:hypothetical protein